MKKTRFVVLTHAQLSWFKRNPGDTEYGDERGAIPLDQVTSVKLDGEKIEVFDQGGLRRWFLCRDGKAKSLAGRDRRRAAGARRSPAASSPREAPSALIIRTRQYAKSIVERARPTVLLLWSSRRRPPISRSCDGVEIDADGVESASRRRQIDGVEGRRHRSTRRRERIETNNANNQRRRGLRGPAKNGDVKIDASSLAKAAAVGRGRVEKRTTELE